jgi:hypothetical protein
MAVLFNPRHEKFAQFLAQGMDQSMAYSKAGFSAKTENAIGASASRLAKDPDIRQRVLEINTKGAKRAEISRSSIIERLRRLSEVAEGNKQLSAAIRAEELIGKDIGMFVDRKEMKVSVLDELSDEQLSVLERELISGRERQAISGDTEQEAGEQDPPVLSGERSTPEGTIS